MSNLYTMDRYIVLLFSFSILLSCRPSYVETQLLDVENYIMERPDSALVVLELMDQNLLVTDENCAHHALLHAMALDKNFIDVADDSLALLAVDYYSECGPEKYYARSLYYLGVAYYNQNLYNKAIVELTRAETIATGVDSLYLAMIKSALSDTYAKCYNFNEEIEYLRESNHIFEKIGDLPHVYSTTLELIHSLYNQNITDEADALLEDLLLNDNVDGLIKNLCKSTQAFNIVFNHCYSEFNKALCIYDNMFDSEYQGWITIKDYWAWAYALNAVGRKEEAQIFIDQLASEESGTTSYWLYMIAKSDGDIHSALAYLEDYIKYNDVEVSDALRQSLALTQRDFYEAQSELSKQQAENSSLWMSVIFISSLFVLVILTIIIVWYVKKQNRIKEQYLTYINEIRRQLEESRREDYPALKKKYLSLYKSKFETIGALCEQYVHSQDLVNAEKSIYRKVVTLVDEFTNDYTNRKKFDAMLDEDLDNIMSNLRAEMPSLKDKDYMIFSFLVIGFDVTTISNLLNITPNTVYIRKSRIKHQIIEKNPRHKEQFIEAIC